MATALPSRLPCTCGCVDQPFLNKGPWTPEEDNILADYISKHGDRGNWRKLPKPAGLMRCGKSCRLRWRNYLRPNLKRGEFGEDEDHLIIQLHALLGNRWALIAGRIPGRTDNEIKNYWNWHLAKKLVENGTDPKTHKPLRSTPPECTKKRGRKPESCTEDSDLKPSDGSNNFNGKRVNRSSSFSIQHQLIHDDEETEKFVVSETISKTPACQLYQFSSPGSAGSWSSESEDASTSPSAVVPSSPIQSFLEQLPILILMSSMRKYTLSFLLGFKVAGSTVLLKQITCSPTTFTRIMSKKICPLLIWGTWIF